MFQIHGKINKYDKNFILNFIAPNKKHFRFQSVKSIAGFKMTRKFQNKLFGLWNWSRPDAVYSLQNSDNQKYCFDLTRLQLRNTELMAFLLKNNANTKNSHPVFDNPVPDIYYTRRRLRYMACRLQIDKANPG